MRVIFRISVAMDTDNYQDAGRSMDRIASKLAKIVAGRGHFDITSFETRPCKAAVFDEQAYEYSDPGVDLSDMSERRRHEHDVSMSERHPDG